MDSFELNKLIAAVLMVALLVIGLGKLSDLVFKVEKPEIEGFKVEITEATNEQSDEKVKETKEVDISSLMN